MKRLFCVVDQSSGNKLVQGGDVEQYYFSSKAKAKEVRNTHNSGTDKCHVSLGPDHKDYRGAHE